MIMSVIVLPPLSTFSGASTIPTSPSSSRNFSAFNIAERSRENPKLENHYKIKVGKQLHNKSRSQDRGWIVEIFLELKMYARSVDV